MSVGVMKDYKLKLRDLRAQTLGCWSWSGCYFEFLFYYESRKRELKTRLIYEDRCDERLKN
jgi:hypothetical protein